MDIQTVIQQATRRVGLGYIRKRDAEAFERGAKDWRAAEKPERLLNRMARLGLDQEMVQLAFAAAPARRDIP
jgi:hypothetical protein